MPELLFHSKTKNRLEDILAHPPHALLLIGPVGAGKTTTIRYIANNLLDANDVEAHPFVRSINASDGDGIAHVREIRSFLSLKTTGNRNIRRIVMLENIDKLGFDAQNAILKTIEEPPEDTVIILTAVSTGNVADTILSRTSQLHVLPLSIAVTKNMEGYSSDDLSKAHALSGGFAGSFKAILESDDSHEIKQAVAVAKDFLSQSVYERLCAVDIIAKDKEAIFKLLVGLEKCLQAAVRSAKTSNLRSLISKLEYVDTAQQSLNNNVNSKLLLSYLVLKI